MDSLPDPTHFSWLFLNPKGFINNPDIFAEKILFQMSKLEHRDLQVVEKHFLV